jgi:hypothetical protein
VRWFSAAAFAVGVAGCAAILGFDDVAYDARDAGSADSTSAADAQAADGKAPLPPGFCADEAPFIDHGLLPAPINQRSNTFARPSVDGLTIYFSADNGASAEDLFFATRSDLDASFSVAMPLDNGSNGLDTQDRNYAAATSSDGRRLVFASEPNQGQSVLFLTERDASDAAFGTKATIPMGMDPGALGFIDPFFFTNSRDEETLYFSNGPIIFRSKLGSGKATPMLGVIDGRTLSAPAVTPDELVIYVAIGTDPQLVEWVRRGDSDSPFDPGSLKGVTGLISGDTWPSWISPDRCTLFYGHVNDARVYELRYATRSP